MNRNKLHWMFRVLRAEEDGSGSSGAPASPAESSASDAGSSVDWADLNEGVSPGADDEEEEGAAPKSSDGSDLEPPPEAPEGTDPAPGDKTDPADPPEDGADPALVPPVPEGETKAPTPEELAAEEKRISEDYAKWEEGEMTRLQKTYAFDEDTAARLQTEPELVLPALAARLHIDVTRRALEAVQRMIPQMVPQILSNTGVEEKAKTFFYGKNPDLVKHHEQVMIAGQMFRKINPKATPEEAAEKVGNMVRQAMGLPPLDPAAPGKPKPPAKPHKPAGAGGGSGTKVSPKAPEKTEWTDLLDDD